MNVYMNYTREIVRIIRKILNIALFHHELFLLYLIQHKVRLIFSCNQTNVPYIIYVLNLHYRISQVYTK